MPALLVSKSPPLSGEVTIHGAKNSVLPILAATLLCRTPCVLHNCPDILDVTHALAILRSLGCASERRGASVYIDPRGCAGRSVPPELAASMRASICEGLECLGVKLDAEKNKTRGEEAVISADDSKVKVWVIPTNEELMIAQDTAALCK